MTYTDSQAIQDIIGAIILIGGILAYRNAHVPAQTIKNLQDSNNSYIELDKARQKAIEELRTLIDRNAKDHANERLELNKAISDLNGQIKVYKELPLRELAEGIKEVVNISRENAASNQQILLVLQRTSVINAEDRNVLTNKVTE